MDNNFAVAGVILKIKGKEQRLTLDEARKLKESLDGLFAKEIQTIPVPYPTQPLYPHPWIVYTSDKCPAPMWGSAGDSISDQVITIS